jgi:hypothetical protein
MNGVYVFVGPTLAVTDARAELDAVYLPPVTAGDVHWLGRLRPRAIGIIDGFFEHAPAVWHKEILWIMEQGVHVFGSAGMGALRAVELEMFGMRGVGSVYQAFKDGTLDQDDEVAVALGDSADGYRPRSEAMVNIRQTLLAAERENVISETTCSLIMRAAKSTFYAERNWPDLIDATLSKAADPAELAALGAWLQHQRVDQMAEDALAMLREMRSFLATDPAPLRVRWATANTTIWNAARHRTDRPGSVALAGGGPTLEAILDEVRLLGPGTFEDVRRRGLLRFFASGAAERDGLMVDAQRLAEASFEFRSERGLEDDADFAAFLAANDMSVDEFGPLLAADEKARWACGRAEEELSASLLDDLRIRDLYQQFASRAGVKASALAGRDYQRTASGEPGDREPDALRWYFADRLGIAVPADLASHARSSGFRDELAFRTAVWQEYCFVAGQRYEPQETVASAPVD